MAWVLLASQICLGGVLLIAATGKVIHPDGFLAALRLSRLPSAFIRPLGLGVPTVEYSLAFAVLVGTPLTLRGALGATLVLFATFTVWMAWVRARRLHIRCACFGTVSTEIGPRSIVRNGVLLLVAAGGLILAGQTTSPLPAPSAALAIVVSVTGMGFALLLALRAALPSLVLSLGQLEAQRTAARHQA